MSFADVCLSTFLLLIFTTQGYKLFGAEIISYWRKYQDFSAKRMNILGSLLTENEKELWVP